MQKNIYIKKNPEKNARKSKRRKKLSRLNEDDNNDCLPIRKNQTPRSITEESVMPVIVNKKSSLPATRSVPIEEEKVHSIQSLIYNNWRLCLVTIISIIFLTTSIRWSHELDTIPGDRNIQGNPNFSLITSFQTTGDSEEDLSPGENVRLSKSLQYLEDLETSLRNTDVPFYFHVPRSGGSTVKDILGSCIGIVQASDVGARNGRKHDKALEVIQEENGSHFVNVDTTTAEGIHRAKKLGLVPSGLADIIVTQHLHPAATLFSTEQKGRMFALIRHPIERAVSLFYYLGVAEWEPTYDPNLNYVSIEMWARSERIEHNWMTRFLSNELERDLTPRHLEVAKEVLRKKCLIGLLEKKAESFDRFEKFFGWTYPNKHSKECRDRLLNWGWSNKHSHPLIEPGSSAWDLLSKKNYFDMQLYEYSKQLFSEQARFFTSYHD